MGQEKGEKFMSYLSAVAIIGFVGADPEQRQARNNNGGKFTRTISHLGVGRRHAEVVEQHRRRMGLEDRVASRLRVPPPAVRIRRNDDQERFARARRGQPRQHHVRTKREWKKSGGPSRLRTSKPPHSKLGPAFFITSAEPSLRKYEVIHQVRRAHCITVF